MRAGRVDRFGVGGREFMARDDPGTALEGSSYGGGRSLLSKCGV
jgi:hypothetical protein